MRLEAGNLGNVLHAQGGYFLPRIGRLPGDLQFLGDHRHAMPVAKTADCRINSSRHRVVLVNLFEAASFNRLTSNVKQKWKQRSKEC